MRFFVSAADTEDNIAHIFVTEEAEFARQPAQPRTTSHANAAIWLSWPKKSAEVPVTVTEYVIRALALPLGLVDIKAGEVDAIWLGCKLVLRKELCRARTCAKCTLGQSNAMQVCRMA